MGKTALQYVKRGLINQSDLDFLAELDPSRTQKYLPFIIKSYLADTDLDLLRNRVTEYDTLLNRNQIDRKDINSFRTFQQLDEYVEKYNNIKSTRELKREMKQQAEIILDNDDLFIVCPYSHPASRLYGAGTKFCTTAENSSHFERYFFEHLVTFYYVQVRSDKIKNNLKQDIWRNAPIRPDSDVENLCKVGIAVYRDGRIEAYSAINKRIGNSYGGIEKSIPLFHYLNAIGVDDSIFVPRGIEERLDDSWQYKKYDTELDLSRMALTHIPDSIGENMFQLEKLILSENNLKAIPESIGLLSKLTTLYIFHNQLTSLPESLRNLKNLQWLGLSGNYNIPRRKIKELQKQLPYTRIYTDEKKKPKVIF